MFGKDLISILLYKGVLEKSSSINETAIVDELAEDKDNFDIKTGKCKTKNQLCTYQMVLIKSLQALK